MLRNCIQSDLEHAHYERIEDDEPFYGEEPELRGVWVTGGTLEACRTNLESTVEGWLLLRLSRNLSIPEIDGFTVSAPKKTKVA